MKTLLVFDIDGTLLLNGTVTGQGFLASFREVVGLEPEHLGVKFHGRTDRGIFRALLGENGSHLDYESLFVRFAEEFTRRMRAQYPTAEGPHTLPGVMELMAALAERPRVGLALGTGNIREIAYLKLRRFGLDHHFPVGGFGGDHEVRADMVRAAIAEARAHYDHDFDPDRCWVIGDTTNDIEAARAAGCRIMAVATGPHTLAELAAADVVVPNLSDTAACVQALAHDA